MTDDTLREECEAAGVIAHYYCIDAYYSCPLSEDDCHDEAHGNVRHLSSDQCTCGYEEKMLALLAFVRAQQVKELREAAKDVCMYCGGRALGKRTVSGPNQAGNYIHADPSTTGRDALCMASAIYSRLVYLEAQATAREGEAP